MTNIAAAAALAQQARKQISSVIHGQQEAIDLLLVSLATGGHALLEGVPGVGKTTIAKTVAATAGLDFKRIQLTPDLMPSDITGHTFYDQSTHRFEIRKGPVFTNILLADEINRAPPRTQSALLEVMEEEHVTIEGTTLNVPSPFLVIATKNPIDVDGVYPLPEAQLDRFMLHIDVGYPSYGRECEMLSGKLQRGVPPGVVEKLVPTLRAGLQAVSIHRDLIAYVVDLTRATRSRDDVQLGCGPRASHHLMLAARAVALLDGRSYVVPDDIKKMAPPVLQHRILLNADAEVSGVTKADIVAQVLGETAVPIEKNDPHA